MLKLNYKTKSDGQLIQKSKYYNVKSFYKDSELMDMFLRLKANVCDLNPALVTKCITGTEQDFILLMNRAKDFIESMFPKTGLEERKILLEMFRECVFGYYVLTPLIVATRSMSKQILGKLLKRKNLWKRKHIVAKKQKSL